jgi:hypothetical protein
LPLREVRAPGSPLRRDRLPKNGRRDQRLHRLAPQLSRSCRIGPGDRVTHGDEGLLAPALLSSVPVWVGGLKLQQPRRHRRHRSHEGSGLR